VQRVSVAGVALLLALANGMSVRDTETAPRGNGSNLTQAMTNNGPIFWMREGFGRLTLRLSALQGLRGSAGADSTLARDILAVAPRPAPLSDRFLSAALETESLLYRNDGQRLNAYLPVVWLRRDVYWRRLDFDVPEPIATPRETSLRFVSRRLLLTIAPGDPARPAFRAMVNVDSLSLVVMMLWALAMAVTAIRRLVEARIGRRRRARGRCPCCGYAMTTVTP
jgi:hypothetical protein